MGQEDPFELYFSFFFENFESLVGATREERSSLFFIDPRVLINRASYQRDNSVIFFKSSY